MGFPDYDGNGNVWNLVSATTGTETARYEYGPFGEPLRLTGATAALNPFRVSTKRTEDGTGLVLYEYRAYSPGMGRWLSRDPIEEQGGANLFAFMPFGWDCVGMCGDAQDWCCLG
jgi:RHS repeat-associated protein